jgi:hypothetical protein
MPYCKVKVGLLRANSWMPERERVYGRRTSYRIGREIEWVSRLILTDFSSLSDIFVAAGCAYLAVVSFVLQG